MCRAKHFQDDEWQHSSSRVRHGTSTTGLVTADGSTLAGLRGSATVQMRFSETSKVHDITAQIIDRDQVTPPIGMEFWKPHKAQFDLDNNSITIRSQEDDGSVIVETIQCWCERDSIGHTETAAIREQISALNMVTAMAQSNLIQHPSKDQ